MSDLVGNPKDRFCSDAAHITTRILEIRIIETGGLTGVKNNRRDDQLCKVNSCAPLPRPDSEIKKRAPVPRLWGSDNVTQLTQLLCHLFHPVVTVLSKQCT